MRFERDFFGCGGAFAPGVLYGGGGRRGVPDAVHAGAAHSADALRYGGGHHAGGKRVELAAARHRAGGTGAAAGVAAMGRWTAARCTCPYPLLERVKLEAQATGGTVDGIDYGAEVTLNLSLPEDAPKRLQDRLTELSAGRLRLELGETQLRPGPREEI